MFQTLYDNGLYLIDGEINYNNDITSKHYFYKVVKNKKNKNNENDDYYEGKTIGYLSAYKHFIGGIDNPFEISAYISK